MKEYRKKGGKNNNKQIKKKKKKVSHRWGGRGDNLRGLSCTCHQGPAGLKK